MSDPTPDSTPTPMPPPVVLTTQQGPTVFSPSPNQGEQPPSRRAADVATYKGAWSAVGAGLLVWSISFFSEIADLTWADLTTLKFIATHAAQVLGVIAAVIGARQVKS